MPIDGCSVAAGSELEAVARRKPLEQKLRRRLLAIMRRPGRYRSAEDWNGRDFGYGAGRAHPCVEFVGCEHCKARRGELCRGATRFRIFGTHVARTRAFQQLKRKVLIDD